VSRKEKYGRLKMRKWRALCRTTHFMCQPFCHLL